MSRRWSRSAAGNGSSLMRSAAARVPSSSSARISLRVSATAEPSPIRVTMRGSTGVPRPSACRRRGALGASAGEMWLDARSRGAGRNDRFCGKLRARGEKSDPAGAVSRPARPSFRRLFSAHWTTTRRLTVARGRGYRRLQTD